MLSTEERNQFLRRCYEIYQLDWMKTHGYSIQDVINVMEEAVVECAQNTDILGTGWDNLFCSAEEFFDEQGFNGSMYVCADEFWQNEFYDVSYMKSILPEDMYEKYRENFLLTWDEIYENANGTGYGDPALQAKDEARAEIDAFVLENFGYDLEKECAFGVIESVEERLDYFADKYNIYFTIDGRLVYSKTITMQERLYEIRDFCFNYPDRENKNQDVNEFLLNFIRRFIL